MAEEVAAWLRDHPDFLARRPELYRLLTPPRRIHGENLADHMAAMVAAERGRVRAMEAEVAEAIADGRAGMGLVLRVRLAVLALLRARDVVETVVHEWPALLRVETCQLLAEPAPPHESRARRLHGLRPLPEGAVRRLLGTGRDARVRTDPDQLDLLHAEAAGLVARDALVRVPLWHGTPCLLSIGAREAAALPMRQATQTLAFLGRAVAAALSR